MKTLVRCLIALAVICSAVAVGGKTLDEYVQVAEKQQKAGYLEKAIKTMEQATEEYPESSEAYGQLGVFLSVKAQRTKGFMEIFEIAESAFEMWDKALSLDPNNFTVRFYRGSWGIGVPEFLGKLDQGIADLEFIVQALSQSPDPEAQGQLLEAYQSLGTGYQKLEQFKKARGIYEDIIEKSPGTEHAKKAEEAINQIALFQEMQAQRAREKGPDSPAITALKEKIAQDPDNSSLHKELGKAYLDAGKYDDAEQALKKAIRKDPADVQVHKWLALALIGKVEGGYDQRIYANTNFLTNSAFEITNVLDKAIALAPEDTDIRLMRGIGGVQMPFFVGKLDQAIGDLNVVIESTPHDSIKAEALYWLGTAYRKKSTTSWIEVVSKYSGTPAAQLVFGNMNPAVKRLDLSKYQPPIIAIDFVLGFRDELAPQTAVWIEDADGNFIKTIYVSGFSGYAKEKQINLPIWSSSSQFADVDGVTAASIDLGHHVYVWDLKDHSGKKVPSGEYIVKVEVSYWPSMKYQIVSASIALGKKEEQTVVEEGNFIPYLEVAYYPK